MQTAMARQKAQEKVAKAKKGGTSQLKQNAAAATYIVSTSATAVTAHLMGIFNIDPDKVRIMLQCNICRTAFLCTMSKEKLQEHVTSKHEKSTFEVCAMPCFLVLRPCMGDQGRAAC